MNHPTPTATELAHLAAAIKASNPKAGDDSLAFMALNLWKSCAHTIDAAIVQAEERARVAALPPPLNPIPQPKRFPATLDDFLLLICPGKTVDERKARFKQWIDSGRKLADDERYNPTFRASMAQQDGEVAVKHWTENPILEAGEWDRCAGLFRSWWKGHNREVKVLNGSKPKRKKKSAKGGKKTTPKKHS